MEEGPTVVNGWREEQIGNKDGKTGRLLEEEWKDAVTNRLQEVFMIKSENMEF